MDTDVEGLSELGKQVRARGFVTPFPEHDVGMRDAEELTKLHLGEACGFTLTQQVLGKSEAETLLHQYQRPMKEVEHRGQRIRYIEVTKDDVEMEYVVVHRGAGHSQRFGYELVYEKGVIVFRRVS